MNNSVYTSDSSDSPASNNLSEPTSPFTFPKYGRFSLSENSIYIFFRKWFRGITGIDSEPSIVHIGIVGSSILLIILLLSIVHINSTQQFGITGAANDYNNHREFNQIINQNICSIPENIYRLAGYRFTKLSHDPISSLNINGHDPTTPQIFLDLQASTVITCVTRFDDLYIHNIIWSVYDYPVLQHHNTTQLQPMVNQLILQLHNIHAPKNISLYIDSHQTPYTFIASINDHTFALTNIYYRACAATLLPNFTLIVRDLYSPNCQNLEKLLSLTLT